MNILCIDRSTLFESNASASLGLPIPEATLILISLGMESVSSLGCNWDGC